MRKEVGAGGRFDIFLDSVQSLQKVLLSTSTIFANLRAQLLVVPVFSFHKILYELGELCI